MKITLESITSKLNEPDLEKYKVQLIEMVEYFTQELIKFEPNRTKPLLNMGADNAAEKAINNYAVKWMDNFSNEDKVYQVIDSLRHAFSSFAYNGLHQLYTRQENEVWYPKILLNEILEPNDINTLEDLVTIYRGCGTWEYEKGMYGQAWSTSKERANDFAFKHYASQPWFDNNKRIVLKTVYPKDKVLFSDQTIEHEVVIQTKYLTKVEKCT
jgi:hypothetical protein